MSKQTVDESAGGAGSNSDFDVDYAQLQEDLDALSSMKQGVSEANGELRAKIESILDQRGYHKKALATIRDFEAMSETKRADVLRTFAPMFETMMEEKWQAEIEADLLNEDGDGEGGDAE